MGETTTWYYELVNGGGCDPDDPTCYGSDELIIPLTYTPNSDGTYTITCNPTFSCGHGSTDGGFTLTAYACSAPEQTVTLITSPTTTTWGAGSGNRAIGEMSWKVGPLSEETTFSVTITLSHFGTKSASNTITLPASSSPPLTETTETATINLEIGVIPTIKILPTSECIVENEITFTADVLNNPTTITWDCGDGTTEIGQTVTHVYHYGVPYEVTITATASNDYGSSSDSVTINVLSPTWGLYSPPLSQYLFFDNIEFGVLRENLTGMSGTTGEVVSVGTPYGIGELYQATQYGKRPVTMRVVCLGKNRAELELRRQKLNRICNPYSGELRLYSCSEQKEVKYLTVRTASGYPKFSRGTAPDEKTWEADLQFTATDPCWYLSSTVSMSEGVINNPGDLPCGATIVLGSEGATNQTTGQSIKPAVDPTTNADYNLTGIVVITDYSSITATDGTQNVLYKLNLDTEFFQIEPGDNQITGALGVTIRPKWGGL